MNGFYCDLFCVFLALGNTACFTVCDDPERVSISQSGVCKC